MKKAIIILGFVCLVLGIQIKYGFKQKILTIVKGIPILLDGEQICRNTVMQNRRFKGISKCSSVVNRWY